jgi:hypothetical protein
VFSALGVVLSKYYVYLIASRARREGERSESGRIPETTGDLQG